MKQEEDAEKTDESPENPEEEASEEPDESGEEETAETPSPPAEEPKAPKPSDEMKVIIVMKKDAIMLGVQSPDCDPVYKTMKGDLAAALKQVPALVTKAKKQWATNPLYPKANLPEPPPSTTTTRTPSSLEPAKPKVQPSFF